jgi:hypothetical protein
MMSSEFLALLKAKPILAMLCKEAKAERMLQVQVLKIVVMEVLLAVETSLGGQVSHVLCNKANTPGQQDKQVFETDDQHNAPTIQRSPCSPGIAPAPTMLVFLAFLSSAVWKITGSPTIPISVHMLSRKGIVARDSMTRISDKSFMPMLLNATICALFSTSRSLVYSII